MDRLERIQYIKTADQLLDEAAIERARIDQLIGCKTRMTTCSICDATFRTQVLLKKHKDEIHSY
jgi:hypothetical protein